MSDLPLATTGLGRRLFRVLWELQDEYPNAILHAHGLYSYRVMFGLGYASVDIDPRTVAKKGKVYLPNGKDVTYERAAEEPAVGNTMGFQPHELSIPRNRCMYNIKSAEWAGRHFQENLKFKHKGFAHVNPDDPTQRPAQNQVIFTKRKPKQAGDLFLCDMCSWKRLGKYFRTGAICAVPDSEPQQLAEFFKTRDFDVIINGLGTLLAAQTRRAERGLLPRRRTRSLTPR